MAERKRLVLDANILIRGCLGVRVRALIADSAGETGVATWTTATVQRYRDC